MESETEGDFPSLADLIGQLDEEDQKEHEVRPLLVLAQRV